MAKKKDQEVKQQPVEAVAETQPKKKSASKNKAASTSEEEPKESSTKTEKKADGKQQSAAEAPKKEEQQGEKQHREPQMVTVNGGKVTHAHAYQSNKNPEDWFFTAKIDGKELHPQKMTPEDVAAYSKKDYPTKLMKQIPIEEYKASNTLSDGRVIDKMNVYKEANEQSQNFGKWMLYAQVGEQKMSTTLPNHDLNAYFDRVTTPSQLVEKNFGQRLHLASHYEQFKLPEGAEIKDIRVSKDADNKWRISADMGERGITAKKELSFDDGYALFHTKTATRQQLAAKYLLTPEINEKMGVKQETSLGLKL